MTLVRASRGRARPHRALLAAVVCVSLVALVTGCARKARPTGLGALGNASVSPSNPAAPVATPTGATTVPATPTMPTTAPATTPHTTAPVVHTYPSDYAGAILTAWGGGDKPFLTLLTSASIAQHLTHDLGDPDQHWTHVNGEGAMGSTYETYYNQDGDEITIRLSNQAIAAHHWHAGALQTWDPMTYPNDDVAYTQAFANAWVGGNKTRMELLASQHITAHFLGLTTPDSSFAVAEVSGSGTTGHIEVEITDSATSLDVKLVIATPVLGMAHAIEDCDPTCS